LINGETAGSLVGINTGGGCDEMNDDPPGINAVQLNDDTVASGNSSMAIGVGTVASGTASFSQGTCTEASGQEAAAFGELTEASGRASFTMGTRTLAEGANAHAQGLYTIASGYCSHAEGGHTTASANYSHSEGEDTVASGYAAHASGVLSVASGFASHAEGDHTTASGYYAHAEGVFTEAIGNESHAANYYTIARGQAQTAIGRYNIAQGTADAFVPTDSAFIIGNGTGQAARSNAMHVTWAGNAHAAGSFTGGGADYAEMFEWLDGNPNGEDRAGYFVTLEKNRIRKAADKDEYILGVVSSTPSVVGDCHGTGWHAMYLRDDFDRIVYEWVEVDMDVPLSKSEMDAWLADYEKSQEDAKKEKEPISKRTKMPTKTEKVRAYRPKLNPAYDPSKTYVSRDQRREWSAVGMMGKLVVYDDGTCKENGFCTVSAGGIATASESGYRVMERISEDKIRIVYLP